MSTEKIDQINEDINKILKRGRPGDPFCENKFHCWMGLVTRDNLKDYKKEDRENADFMTETGCSLDIRHRRHCLKVSPAKDTHLTEEDKEALKALNLQIHLARYQAHLATTEHVPYDQLREDKLYEVHGRNISIGFYQPPEKVVGIRWKFGDARIEDEYLLREEDILAGNLAFRTVTWVVRELCDLPEGFHDWDERVRLGWMLAWDDNVTQKEKTDVGE